MPPKIIFEAQSAALRAQFFGYTSAARSALFSEGRLCKMTSPKATLFLGA
jgi:hypothetical protein